MAYTMYSCRLARIAARRREGCGRRLVRHASGSPGKPASVNAPAGGDTQKVGSTVTARMLHVYPVLRCLASATAVLLHCAMYSSSSTHSSTMELLFAAVVLFFCAIVLMCSCAPVLLYCYV